MLVILVILDLKDNRVLKVRLYFSFLLHNLTHMMADSFFLAGIKMYIVGDFCIIAGRFLVNY